MASRPASRRPSAARAQQERRQRSARLAAIVGLVVLAAVAALSVAGTEVASGSSAPEAWDLPAIEGQERVELDDFAGTPTVVNFFASWCTACDAELPAFARVSDELRGDVDFVGVNALETGDRLLMPERHGVTWWTLARDIGIDGGDLHRELGGRGMPLTAWYDAEGTLVHVDGGAIDEGTLRERIRTLYGIEV